MFYFLGLAVTYEPRRSNAIDALGVLGTLGGDDWKGGLTGIKWLIVVFLF